MPLAILRENSLEHALPALGAMRVGRPAVLRGVAGLFAGQPGFRKAAPCARHADTGLVYAADWERYGRAIEAVDPSDTEVIINSIAIYQGSTRATGTFDSLFQTKATPQVDVAMQATGPDAIVKFLFTSGSTKLPKAVINTQRMICANQQQMRQSLPVLSEEPLILVDWIWAACRHLPSRSTANAWS